jgi:hypothetical protein
LPMTGWLMAAYSNSGVGDVAWPSAATDTLQARVKVINLLSIAQTFGVLLIGECR